MCRVAIVSPLPVVATGLAGLLASHAQEFQVVPLDTGLAPDIVLYDVIGLHEGDGADLDALIQQRGSRVLVVAHDLRPDLGSRALARGADGLITLAVDSAGLREALHSAVRPVGVVGGRPRVVGAADSEDGRHRLGGDVGLTPREIDVLSLITQGFSNQEIAEIRYLSINSVKTYIRSAYRRIGVSNRSQAVVWCLQHGFPTEPGADTRR